MNLSSPNISLFQTLQGSFSEHLDLITATKLSLVHLSHVLEEIVLHDRVAATLFTGFQQSVHWHRELKRYRQLASVADQIYIFAGGAMTDDSPDNLLRIQLDEGDPIRQEWFVLIISDRFSVLLCGLDSLRTAYTEAEREFDTFWTFSPTAIHKALDVMEQTLSRYFPDSTARIEAVRQRYEIKDADPAVIAHFTTEVMRYHERLNQRLRQSEEMFREVIASISHHIYVWAKPINGDPYNLFISPRLVQNTGYSEAYINGHWLTEVVHSEDRAAAMGQFNRLLKGQDSRIEYRVICADGTVIWVEDSARVKRAPNGDLTIYGVIQDITVRRMIERDKLRDERIRTELSKELELTKLKSSFMTTVSHEFRTPLAVILSSAQNIIRYVDKMSRPDKLAKLGIITEQVEYMRHMLDDINLVIQAGSNRLQFQPRIQRVCELMKLYVSEVQTLSHESHPITCFCDHDDIEAPIDENLLRHIVHNLLNNSIQYTPVGTPIECSIQFATHHIAIHVRDYGPGIRDEDLPYIFEPFFRGPNSDEHSGTGLGLPIVRELTQLHRGSITVNNNQGRGVTFTILLPLT